ncbi:flagellar hook-associated protein FlgK [Novosphingobium sp. 9]|uniref:flagellar hook-associated protein FlgK n=1 Tax=Novosphingobium sp. 9 TaxID=2025349 RepID=UPI0021B595A5|nr:flagellar hook-associated protein FlgK [Novosphingobium sp. 9]
MSSDMMSIAKSGIRASRAALDVTASNIANAASETYVRRSVTTVEVVGGTLSMTQAAVSLSGTRITGITRNADTFRQAEVRRTGADAARADAEVTGLTGIESAVEQSGAYDAVVDFEASLQQLATSPTDGSLRAATVEKARTMAQTFNTAAQGLDAAGEGLRLEAQGGVDSVNSAAAALAKVNQKLSRAIDGSSDQSSLLDQRDALLEQMSQQTGIATTINADKTATVTLGGATGVALVNGASAGTLAMTSASDGTIAFSVTNGGTSKAVTLDAGALAGKSQALVTLASTRSQLDAVAASVIGTVNAAQAQGVDIKGNAGQPLFSGTGAGDMAMVASGGDALATAPAGAAAGSRDASNLTALRSAWDSATPARAMDQVLFDISSAVAGRTVTRDTLQSIADTTSAALKAQTGVDFDEEATNLVRYQQAYQASGRVMQVASDIFDTILGIR